MLFPKSSGSKVLFCSLKRVFSKPCWNERFCKSHSPAWSQTGQSSGWLISKNSDTAFRASIALSEVILVTSIPSLTPLLQEGIILGIGRGSASLPFDISTKQARQFPPVPSSFQQ